MYRVKLYEYETKEEIGGWSVETMDEARQKVSEELEKVEKIEFEKTELIEDVIEKYLGQKDGKVCVAEICRAVKYYTGLIQWPKRRR